MHRRFSLRIVPLFLTAFVTFGLSSCKTGNEPHLPTRTVYVAGTGYFDYFYKAGYWKDGVWTRLPLLVEDLDSHAYGMAIDGDDIYVCGVSDRDSSFLEAPCYWKNGELNVLPALDATKKCTTTGIAIVDGHVCVSGSSVTAEGKEIPGYWKDGAWIPLTYVDGVDQGRATSIFADGLDIYCAAYFRSVGGAYDRAGYAKNGSITALSPLIDETAHHNHAWKVAVSGGDVYALGDSVDDYESITPLYWKNGTKFELSHLGVLDSCPSDLALSGSHVYIVGYRMVWEKVGGTDTYYKIPGYWLDGTWNELSSLLPRYSAWAQGIAIDGSDVYVSGYALTTGYSNRAGYWKNRMWTELGVSGLEDTKHGVDAVQIIVK
jgi:hypothetical protein